MNIWGIIIFILGLIVVVAIWQGGFENFKANPLESSWQSSKSIIETGKSFINSEDNNTIEIGKIPCATNEDCNTLLPECENLCTCYTDGICRR